MTIASLNQDAVAQLTERLNAVGKSHDGTYLWHRTKDPYVVILAEFFLRLSNRTTVHRYLPSFLDRFPDLRSLASATVEDVLAASRWAGMRTRVSHLPQIAEALLHDDRGRDMNGLLELPHIGPYAAGAIALYGFGQPTFPVDNNVRRVIGRYLELRNEHDIQAAAVSVRDTACRNEDSHSVRHVHLGALVLGWESCRVSPRCERCPLVNTCGHARHSRINR